jgi:hypothetical protein
VVSTYDQGAGAYETLWSTVILPPAAALVRFLDSTAGAWLPTSVPGPARFWAPSDLAAPVARGVALNSSVGFG